MPMRTGAPAWPRSAALVNRRQRSSTAPRPAAILPTACVTLCRLRLCVTRGDVAGAGHRLPDTVLPRLFESFAVAEAIGRCADFGLRLAVARGILSLFDGTIAAVNLAPAGIRFAITLPNGDGALS